MTGCLGFPQYKRKISSDGWVLVLDWKRSFLYGFPETATSLKGRKWKRTGGGLSCWTIVLALIFVFLSVRRERKNKNHIDWIKSGLPLNDNYIIMQVDNSKESTLLELIDGFNDA